MTHVSKTALVAVVALSLLPTDAPAANTCNYNNATASFGGNYTDNVETGAAPLACMPGTATAAARLNNTSGGRSTVTAPFTGDLKFLLRTSTLNATVPSVTLVLDSQKETMAFPDSNIIAPAGGGCDDGLFQPGINSIERRLHRAWPLFGKTYYFGDYNSSPPNDPTLVTSSTSLYNKWWPFEPTQSYVYGQWQPTSSGFGTGINGSAAGYYPTPLPMIGNTTTGACGAAALTAAEMAACVTCLNTRGYYLHDGMTAGDLAKSAFMGTILNDYPPAWVHFAWAFGLLENDTIADATGGPLFKMMHETTQTQTTSCNQSRIQTAAGWVPSCPKVYPVYDWAFIQGDQKWAERQKAGEGQNQNWGTYGGIGAGNTPAGDLMAAANEVVQLASTGCKNCQTKAVIDIGFGIPCGETRPAALPVQTMAACTGECAYNDTSCGCGGATGNFLAEAAHYVYNAQGVRAYFLGMGPHTGAMRRAAAEGHGKYFDARSVEAFHDGLISILMDIISTATSSATSTVNSIQVNVAGQEELVPRFVASATNGAWEGHLLKYYLFDEFSANCAKAGDLEPVPNSLKPVCTAKCVCPGGACTATWLVDSQCNLMAPDSTGFMFQATWNGTKLVPSTAAGVPVWDVNDKLKTTAWWKRNVYTAIDSNNDGKIDASDGVFSLTSGATAGLPDLTGGVSDVVADALMPYLALDGTNACPSIESTIGVLIPGATQAQYLRNCARLILNYTLGEDVRNENFLTSTDPNYMVIDRINMLGDIFHSSPQNIGPPASAAACDQNPRRCTRTLFGAASGMGASTDHQPLELPAQVIDPLSGLLVANPGGVHAYQAYYLSETFGQKRPNVTLFGANDGMLHAVQTGCYAGSKLGTDPLTQKSAWFPIYYDGPGDPVANGCAFATPSNGVELWGFIPPDLLPKLGLVLRDKHQMFVDSSPMVRDIYAPTAGTSSPLKRYTLGSTATMDFKRVAITGEREGGTHWTALDVTDPTSPKFLWTFPPVNSADELGVGFSWGDWVPNAPPIVPVRLAAPTGVLGYPTYVDSSGTAKAFQEKWVVALPGGYDPYGIAGKNVYLLDAYSGQKIWEMASGTGTARMDFPFAAMPTLVAWGKTLTEMPPTYNLGYWDSLVVGDLGGQVWTARLNDVGQNIPVTNWYAGRAFREHKAEDLGAAVGEYHMQHRTPIFQMASLARMATGELRAFVGTGDRANMAESDLGDCSLYNTLACAKRQCTVVTATNTAIGATAGPSGLSSYKGDAAATYTSTTNAGSFNTNVCSPDYTELNACISCGANASYEAAAPNEPQYACTNTASGWNCATNSIGTIGSPNRLEMTNPTVTPDPNTDVKYFSHFLAVNLFDATRTLFTSQTAATAYDGASLTESGLKNLFPTSPFTFPPGGATGPTLTDVATGSDPGYFFYYPVLDERTATNSIVAKNCVAWYTMEPGVPCTANADCLGGGTCNTTTHTCVAPVACGSTSSAIPARSAFLYTVNATTGSTKCGLTATTVLRTAADTNAFVLPPPPEQTLVSVNAQGQVMYSIVTPAGQAAPPGAIGSGAKGFNYYQTLEIPRELHQCRHGYDPNACY